MSPDEFKKMLDEFFLLNGVFNISDSISWIDFMDLQGYVKRMKTVSKKFDRFLEHVLDEHNERRKTAEEKFEAKERGRGKAIWICYRGVYGWKEEWWQRADMSWVLKKWC
ncbi:unnamed protein product [Lactuca saligna]|uniref:Uncharacterized protein n=1 Tax=Lactuca saligna TaxID=75948 RepID=A0AA35ZR95_LACSI|nr:unnamed protein product [Lactuca saligna]